MERRQTLGAALWSVSQFNGERVLMRVQDKTDLSWTFSSLK